MPLNERDNIFAILVSSSDLGLGGLPWYGGQNLPGAGQMVTWYGGQNPR